jgi:hypothetical protein
VARNGDLAVEVFGDAEGVLTRTDSGEPHFVAPFGHLIRNSGETWTYVQGMVTAQRSVEALTETGPSIDIRTVGLATTFRERAWLGFDDVMGLKPLPFEVRDVGDLKVVSLNDSGGKMTWYINPSKGWNAERVTIESDERGLLNEVVCSLAQSGDVWFPETVEYRSGNGEVLYTVDVHSAAFGEDAPIASITPADVGVEPGVRVFGRTGSVGVWDGEMIVDHREWARAVKNGTKANGPNVAYTLQFGAGHLIKNDPSVLGTSSGSSDPWHRYVTDFASRHEFSEPQRKAALSALKDCQRARDKYLAANMDRLSKVRQDRGLTPEQRTGKIDSLAEPISRIFEERLKPQLVKMLTREQEDKCACHD